MAADPKIAVLGAGSVGCFVGGAWAAAGLDVHLIGRQAIADDIAAHGLTLTDYRGARVHLPAGAVRFSTRAQDLARADLIALCVKSTATEAAARDIARFARPGTTVVSFQNGISNPDTVRRAAPRLDVLQGVVGFNIAYQGAGRWHKGVSGDLVVQGTPATEALSGRVGDGLGQVRLARDIAPIAWGKLLLNLNNAVNALSGLTLLEQLKQRDYRRVLAASILEALEILEAAGIEPAKVGPIPPKLLPHAIGAPDLIFNKLLLKIQTIDEAARSSMADDVAAGRETEIDYLNGEVVRLARTLGRKAPVNQAIVDLVRQREAGVEHLWSAEDLRKYVLEGRRGVAIFGY